MPAPDSARHLDTGSPDPEWHDIQAMFVDDPQGSVQRAARAADAAVTALSDRLQHQRNALTSPAAEVGGENGSTERLREQLRSYRIFCQTLADLQDQLPEPATTNG